MQQSCEAESKKREAMLEIREETFKSKNELEKEIQNRRNEVQKNERRIQQKEEQIDNKVEQLERREQSLAAKEENLQKLQKEVSQLNEQRIQELERISGLTSEQAKEHLLKIVEDEVKLDSARMIKSRMKSRRKKLPTTQETSSPPQFSATVRKKPLTAPSVW